MREYEEYLKEIEDLFRPARAFVRMDRGRGLFVTDAPRRTKELPELPGDYASFEENGLLHITPVFTNVPEEFGLAYLKADEQGRERLLRTSLALAMRLKDEKMVFIIRKLSDKRGIHL